jgi:hypothetical protein
MYTGSLRRNKIVLHFLERLKLTGKVSEIIIFVGKKLFGLFSQMCAKFAEKNYLMMKREWKR